MPLERACARTTAKTGEGLRKVDLGDLFATDPEVASQQGHTEGAAVRQRRVMVARQSRPTGALSVLATPLTVVALLLDIRSSGEASPVR